MYQGCLFQQWRVVLLSVLVYSQSFAADNFMDFITELDDTPDPSIWMEYRSYDDDSTDFLMELALPISTLNRFTFGIGESQLHDINQSIDVKNYNIDWFHKASDSVEVGIGYAYWGNDSELWTETVNVLLTFDTRDFRFRIQPRFSTLNMFTALINGRRKLGNTDSKGLGLSLSYYGINDWIFNLSASRYDYEADLTKLNSLLAQLIFSNNTLLLSDSFQEESQTIQIKRQFNTFDLGVVIGRSVSAIDHSKMNSTAINFEWYFNEDVSLMLEAGQTEPEFDDPGNYISTALNVLL